VPTGGVQRVVDAVRRLRTELGLPVAVGVSGVCSGVDGLAAGFREARQAALGSSVVAGAPAVVAYEELGPFKYLLRIPAEGVDRDATVEAVTRLADYDAQRGSSLLTTLEEFLRRRGSISSTSEALFVHPNTLRQRLRRIGELTGLDLRRDDWLMVEIAVKLVKLERAVSG
jgi:purine catabolism regulator